MFKRVRWVGIGAVLGAGGSVYAQLKLRRTAQHFMPPEVSARVVERARALGDDIHTAIAEGRQAMQDREAELRARVDPDATVRLRAVRDANSRPLDPAPGLSRGAPLPERADGARGPVAPGPTPRHTSRRRRSPGAR